MIAILSSGWCSREPSNDLIRERRLTGPAGTGQADHGNDSLRFGTPFDVFAELGTGLT